MIVKPSVTELLEYVDNRFVLVVAVAKRARQLSENIESCGKIAGETPVTIASNEIIEGKVKVC